MDLWKKEEKSRGKSRLRGEDNGRLPCGAATCREHSSKRIENDGKKISNPLNTGLGGQAVGRAGFRIGFDLHDEDMEKINACDKSQYLAWAQQGFDPMTVENPLA